MRDADLPCAACRPVDHRPASFIITITRCPTLGLRCTKPVVLAVLIAVAGCVQPPIAPARSPAIDPANAGAVVPPLVHNSSLTRARPLTETPAVDWKDANDTVSRIGGWRAYAREAAAATAAAAAAPPLAAPASAPASAPGGSR